MVKLSADGLTVPKRGKFELATMIDLGLDPGMRGSPLFINLIGVCKGKENVHNLKRVVDWEEVVNVQKNGYYDESGAWVCVLFFLVVDLACHNVIVNTHNDLNRFEKHGTDTIWPLPPVSVCLDFLHLELASTHIFQIWFNKIQKLDHHGRLLLQQGDCDNIIYKRLGWYTYLSSLTRHGAAYLANRVLNLLCSGAINLDYQDGDVDKQASLDQKFAENVANIDVGGEFFFFWGAYLLIVFVFF